jgi:hypothetical protein
MISVLVELAGANSPSANRNYRWSFPRRPSQDGWNELDGATRLSLGSVENSGPHRFDQIGCQTNARLRW